MHNTRNLAESLLNEAFGYDMAEECAALLWEWYGDDLSPFDPDDEDLNIAFGRLRTRWTFWQTDRYAVSPYQKLRRKYDALIEAYMLLVDDFRAALDENEQLASACQKNHREVVSTKIKGGCGCAIERGCGKNYCPDAA